MEHQAIGGGAVMPTTTLARLRTAAACIDGARMLAKHLGGSKYYGSETPVTLLQVLEVCGLDVALRALPYCDDAARFAREAACSYAESVLPIVDRWRPGDSRSRKAIEASRRFARGEISQLALDDARAGAWAAVQDIVSAMTRDTGWLTVRGPGPDAARACARAADGNVAHSVWDVARLAASASVGRTPTRSARSEQARILRHLMGVEDSPVVRVQRALSGIVETGLSVLQA